MQGSTHQLERYGYNHPRRQSTAWNELDEIFKTRPQFRHRDEVHTTHRIVPGLEHGRNAILDPVGALERAKLIVDHPLRRQLRLSRVLKRLDDYFTGCTASSRS